MGRFNAWLLVAFFGIAFAGCGQQKAKVELPIDRARSLIFQKKYDEAKAVCDALIASNGNDLDALLLRGELFEKQGLLDEARKEYTQAVNTFPKNPKAFQRRQQIYNKLATQENIELAEADRFRVLAAADFEQVIALDPDAEKAFPGYKPMVKFEQTSEDKPQKAPESEEPATKRLGIANADDPLADPNSQTNNNDGNAKESNLAQEGESESQEKTVVNESPEEFLVRQLKEAQEPQEPELPPHEEPEKEESETILQPITKFGLPRDIDGNVQLPTRSGAVATGITQPVLSPESTLNEGPFLNRIYLEDQAGFNFSRPTGVRTGIGSAPSSVGTKGPSIADFRPGFLPETARGAIGPRIVPLRKQRFDDSMDEPPAPTTNRDIPPNATILTTALPGTPTSRGGIAQPIRETGPRLGPSLGNSNRANSLSRPNRFGNITDRNYSPFGQRQKSTLSLPTQTSAQ